MNECNRNSPQEDDNCIHLKLSIEAVSYVCVTSSRWRGYIRLRIGEEVCGTAELFTTMFLLEKNLFMINCRTGLRSIKNHAS